MTINDMPPGYDDWKLQSPLDNGTEATWEECEAVVDELFGKLAQVIDASNLDMTPMEVVQEYWDTQQTCKRWKKEQSNG